MNTIFSNALEKVIRYAESIGMEIEESDKLDPFFKGDLDGKHIWLAPSLNDEEKLFNSLHLIGHNIQWCVDEELFKLGSVLHYSPDDKMIARLYKYEWQANCYGLYILQYLGFKHLTTWLYESFKEDINYLINFYHTGKKEKAYPDDRLSAVDLTPLAPPEFIPVVKKQEGRGIVI